jgi:predicted Zn-dependent protease
MKVLIYILLISSGTLFAQESIVLTAAKKEMDRFMTELKSQPIPPYFISYAITDTKEASITGSFGKILSKTGDNKRSLDIDLRVGDYQFDNTHIIRGEAFNFYYRDGLTQLPLTNDEQALRNAIWYATDKKYKTAIEKFDKALTNTKVKVKEEDTSADFSREMPYKFIGEEILFEFDSVEWEKRVKTVSAIFANYDWLYSGFVSVSFKNTRKYFLSSEGSEIVQSEPYARVFISVKTKADDGMSLPLYKSFFAFDPKELPTEKELIDEAMNLVKTIEELRTAPLMATYSGPALLSGEASGVFFHEIFGHRVEGHRLKDPSDAQTFKSSLGEKVLPEFMSVDFDPTLYELNGIKLSGFYKYDDEGVQAQRVPIVEKGTLKNFLMSRAPIEKFEKSNGHGRRQAGYDAVSRQSNLIVKSDKSVPLKDMKDLLREECKKQDKEYGLYFVKVQGGFTFTGRTIPNSFNVNPLLVYKVFVDGRPDEMVRGVDLIGTPLTTFSNIINTADDLDVFNGTCGAESGGVPVSACSPTLLVNKIEVQKKSKSQAKLPILPAPSKGTP